MTPLYLPLKFFLAWAGAWIAASIVYRILKDKPVLFFGVKNASFQERTASGACADTWWQSLGGASNCLVVAVEEGKLIIRSLFPFTLMFMPEILGLEFEGSVRGVRVVERDTAFGRRRLKLTIQDHNDKDRKFLIYLRREEEFLRALNEYGIKLRDA